MPDPSQKSLLSDVELVEYANLMSARKNRSLREVKEDTMRDAKVIEDRASGERLTVPNKFIRSIGVSPAFELMRPDLFQEYTQQK
ncbi:MAG: hypothetical protein GOVbin2277_23 [Prokaryotic dsDNA virus sp.]|jgi:hypothetical protein|nr:MAG: hypothetical protein GOVbin2277_23 [Prokaryotic dsDNA virus sp.]|tara:strand:- start:185 stop:439 length:255 start_codon:yes stop_codon:yes gene_type:complete